MTSISLTDLLRQEGTDKWKWYGAFYDAALSDRRFAIHSVLEVGIGTLVPDATSTMVGWATPGYRPGGSLRAWRDYFPNASVVGIDVQPDTMLPAEARIATFLCDSTDRASFRRDVAPHARLPFDVIIDDGLHDAATQIATFGHLVEYLHPHGLYVIEDIAPWTLDAIAATVAALRPAATRTVIRADHPEAGPDCIALAVWPGVKAAP
jgi:hypothetical protein